MTLRVAFMGTPQIACPSLGALTEMTGFNVVAVFTQPDRPSGRGGEIKSSSVKYLASSRGIDVFQPASLKDTAVEETIISLDLDLIIVMAYGQILPQRILDLPTYGALNIHASILPRHRGAAPIQWAIIEGDNETGVSLMKMNAGMDTGDVISTIYTGIGKTESAVELTDKISRLGPEILSRDLSKYILGDIEPQRQNEALATHASKIRKADGLIDWTMTANHIHRRMRAFTPWPGIFTYLPKENNRTLKILSAEVLNSSGSQGEVIRADKSGITIGCGRNSLLATHLQRQGGKPMAASDFLNGHHIDIGDILG